MGSHEEDAQLPGMPDTAKKPMGKGARRKAAFDAQQQLNMQPAPPSSGVPVRGAPTRTAPTPPARPARTRTRRHSVDMCLHRDELPISAPAPAPTPAKATVSNARTWDEAAPPMVGLKRVLLEKFHDDITDPAREQNLVSLLMTEIVAHQTDAVSTRRNPPFACDVSSFFDR